MLRFLFVFMAFASAAFGQVGGNPKAHFLSNYDLDATDPTFCVTTGKFGDPWADPNDGRWSIQTSGSSTTITEVTTGSNPFDSISVGDLLIINNGGTMAFRYVVTKTDATEITVDTAIDIENGGAGRKFTWKKVTCGTDADSGWIGVSGLQAFTIKWQIDQLSVTGSVDVDIQCRDLTYNTQPVTIYPDPSDSATAECHTGDFTTVNACALVVTGTWDQCRIGFEIDTADDGTDTGNDAEDITAYIHGRR